MSKETSQGLAFSHLPLLGSSSALHQTGTRSPDSYASSGQHRGPGRPSPLDRPHSGGLKDAQHHTGPGPTQEHSCVAPVWLGGAPVPPETPYLCPGHERLAGLSQPHPGQRTPACCQHGVYGESKAFLVHLPANTSLLTVACKAGWL